MSTTPSNASTTDERALTAAIPTASGRTVL
jgi:hypothetical protein